jgi:hypothetical protein
MQENLENMQFESSMICKMVQTGWLANANDVIRLSAHSWRCVRFAASLVWPIPKKGSLGVRVRLLVSFVSLLRMSKQAGS